METVSLESSNNNKKPDHFKIDVDLLTLEATIAIREKRIKVLFSNAPKIYTQLCKYKEKWDHYLIIEENGENKSFPLTPTQFYRMNDFIKAWKEIDPNLEEVNTDDFIQ